MNIINLSTHLTELKPSKLGYNLHFNSLTKGEVSQSDLKIEFDAQYPDINNINVSCGCTNPIISEVPGESAKIVSIGVKPKSKGDFSKSIKILFTNGAVIFITLTGNVV